MKPIPEIVGNERVTRVEHDAMSARFLFRARTGTMLSVICANDAGWDHVSAAAATRCPTWVEMEDVKRLCFLPEETAFQLHPPLADYVNVHPHVLHIWRPWDVPIPMPPKWLV